MTPLRRSRNETRSPTWRRPLFRCLHSRFVIRRMPARQSRSVAEHIDAERPPCSPAAARGKRRRRAIRRRPNRQGQVCDERSSTWRPSTTRGVVHPVGDGAGHDHGDDRRPDGDGNDFSRRHGTGSGPQLSQRRAAGARQDGLQHGRVPRCAGRQGRLQAVAARLRCDGRFRGDHARCRRPADRADRSGPQPDAAQADDGRAAQGRACDSTSIRRRTKSFRSGLPRRGAAARRRSAHREPRSVSGRSHAAAGGSAADRRAREVHGRPRERRHAVGEVRGDERSGGHGRARTAASSAAATAAGPLPSGIRARSSMCGSRRRTTRRCPTSVFAEAKRRNFIDELVLKQLASAALAAGAAGR